AFAEWARRLVEFTAAGGFDTELDHWTAVAADDAEAEVPVDADGANIVSTQRTVSVALPPDVVEGLLRGAASVFRARVDDVLLAALGRVLCGWTGAGRVLVDVEGHGREELFDGVDVSRTVGWFTSVYPVALEDDADPVVLLKRTKEALRAVPNRGVGFGALRYLGGERAREVLGRVPVPAVGFNYLGRFDTESDNGPVAGLTLNPGGEYAPDSPRPHVLDVVGRVVEDRLVFDWIYSEALHDRETVVAVAERFVAEVVALVELCRSGGVGGATPSDFPLVALDQARVDRLVGDGRGVVDVLP